MKKLLKYLKCIFIEGEHKYLSDICIKCGKTRDLL